jgi:hypothetical protein
MVEYVYTHLHHEYTGLDIDIGISLGWNINIVISPGWNIDIVR